MPTQKVKDAMWGLDGWGIIITQLDKKIGLAGGRQSGDA